MKVTTFYKIPLQWDQYPTDRLMVEEAFERIDKAMNSLVVDGGGVATNVVYDGNEALPGENVADALDRALERTNQFEISMNATSGSDVNEVLWGMSAARSFQLPADLDGSVAHVQSMTPIDLVIRIEQNGVSIGSIDIVQDVPSFNFPDDVLFMIDDELTLVSEGDVNFRTININLLASRL